MCLTLCDPMDYSTLSLPVLHYLLEFAQIFVHWSLILSNHLILCCPLLLPPSIFPSIRVFSSELAVHVRWPKYWSFSFSPSNEYSGLISFRIDWFNLLTVQGTLKSLLQHHIQKHRFSGTQPFSGSHSKNTGVVCHSIFFQNAPLWPVCLGWSCRTWLIASLSYASPIATTRLWSMKELFKYFFH